MQRASSRFYELDLFRFAAAFFVMLYHYTYRGYAADDRSVLPYLSLAPLTKYGYLGVDLFFMISGFVIFMTAIDKTPRYFVISRVIRLYPAFWACCTATFVITVFFGGDRYSAGFAQYLVNMTMLSGFLKIPSIDGVYWSLFIEIKFYFLVFVVLLLRQLHKAKYLLGFWLILTSVFSVWHIKYLPYFFIPEYAHYFIAGACFYLITAEGFCFYKLFLIIASYLVSLRQGIMALAEMEAHFGTSFNPMVIGVILTAFFALFFLVATRRMDVIASPKLVFWGSLTYPLYLLHQHIGFITFNGLYPHINRHVLLWGTVLGILYLAYLVNKKVEQTYSRPLKHVLEKIYDAVPELFRKSPKKTVAE